MKPAAANGRSQAFGAGPVEVARMAAMTTHATAPNISFLRNAPAAPW